LPKSAFERQLARTYDANPNNPDELVK
jgi:hypothetical protein